MIKKYPNKGTTIYIYNPVNLASGICTYTVEKYIPTEYHQKRIDSGLCYLDEESVLQRINEEREQLKKR